MSILKSAAGIGFLLLGVAAVVDWLRHRGRSRGYLAAAVACLGGVIFLGLVLSLTHYQFMFITYISLLAFLLSGYFLVLFRDSLVPMRRSTRVGLLALVIIDTVLGVVAQTPADGAHGYTPLQLVSLFMTVGTWVVCIAEPSLRLLLSSGGRPAVQRARLRALSIGYALIAVVVVVTIVGYTVGGNSDSAWVQVGLNLLGLAMIPVIFVSFAPPRFLRRAWREGEEEAFREAIQELLLLSPDRATLAGRSLEWAIRLVGADGGAITDSDGVQLAVRGIGTYAARELSSGMAANSRVDIVRLPNRPGLTAIRVALPLEGGLGSLLVIAGPVTPVFGTDEVNRLGQYSAAITAALDRARLVEAVRESERRYRLLSEELERRVELRTAELEASNRELEAFSYTVSHDLRAPLRAIDGFARILLDEYARDLPEAPAHYLEVIGTNAQDMGKLIDGLLTFARLNRQPLKRQNIDPTTIARKVVALLEPELEGRTVTVLVDTMPAAASDPTLLEQVYSNLIGNAVKFTRRRQEAVIEVGATELAAEGTNPVYFVRDNGAGFDMQHSGKLFGVFQRLHRTEEFEGTGAGLAIVQRIVQRHGGRIWAEATPDVGATFFFTLAEAA